MAPRLKHLWMFLLISSLLGSEAKAQPVVATIVSAGSSMPNAMTVSSTGGDMVDLIAGRQKLPEVGSLRLSMWVVGGSLLAPLLHEEAITGDLVSDTAGLTRFRFRIPAFQAKPGATLKLAITDKDTRRIVAEVYLLVAEWFDPTPLRQWIERHPVAVDSALEEISTAFKQWGVPHGEVSGSLWAITGANSKPPDSATIVVVLHLAKDHRTRIFIHQISGEVTRIDASLPNLSAISRDSLARRDFLMVLGEVAKLLGDDPAFSEL